MIHPSIAVLEHNLVNYRRTWRATVFTSFLMPVLFLLAMGKSVGSYVDARASLGLPYVDYIAPGLLAATALQVAVAESTWPVYSALQWTRVYYAMLAAPLRVVDLLIGHLGYAVVRVTATGAGFLIVMAAFGTLHSPRAIGALAAAMLLGLACAAPAFAFAASVSTDGMFPVLLRFAVLPMTLFAGVFFPVESLPTIIRPLAYASPLWHGVELARAATLGADPAWAAPAHVGYLLLWVAGGLLLARRAFTRKLLV
ncbi:MAG TPA: ABC transporter permease [Micromonosporaceae bacterium]|nr:ABC transporter permease [Micromonosporaceae bacterium]